MARVVINKHYDSASGITLNSFTSDVDRRKGEFIIVNDATNPGIFIVDTNGNIVNVSQQFDVESIQEILNSLMKREVLTDEEYQYKLANNLIDDECMYYIYEEETSGSTGTTGETEDEFIPVIISGTEIMEVDEEAVTGEVVEIVGGSYEADGEVFVLPEYSPVVPPEPDEPEPSEPDAEVEPVSGGEDYQINTNNTPEDEILELNLSVEGEVATI